MQTSKQKRSKNGVDNSNTTAISCAQNTWDAPINKLTNYRLIGLGWWAIIKFSNSDLLASSVSILRTRIGLYLNKSPVK